MRRTPPTYAARIVALAALAGLALAAHGCRDAPDPPNVLVIVPDTVRADHLSVYGYARNTSPHLDTLAAQGTTFTRAVTVAPRTWQSFTSILTGLYPPHHGVRFVFDRPLADDVPHMGSLFRDAGYATAAFDTIPFVHGMTNGRGFEAYLGPGPRANGQTDDEALLEVVASWILAREPSEPFLAFVRLTGAHWPYTNGPIDAFADCAGHDHDFNTGTMGVRFGAPGEGFTVSDAEQYRRRMWNPPAGRTLNHMIAHYDAEIRSFDAALGRLLDRLETRGVLARTIVVVTSDHGESFGEQGYLQHGPRVDESVMHVPLVFRLPDPVGSPEMAGARVNSLVRVVDVLPTLLELAEIAPPARLDGASLLPALRGNPVASRWAYGESGRSFMGVDPERFVDGVAGKHRMIRKDDWKLVHIPRPSDPVERLFDLASDPGEVRDLVVREGERAATLRRLLETIDDRPREGASDPPLSEAQREQLRSLGYLQ